MKVKCKQCREKKKLLNGKVECDKTNCHINYPGTEEVLEFSKFDVSVPDIIEDLEIKSIPDEHVYDSERYPYCGIY